MLRDMDWVRLGSLAYAIAFPVAFLLVAIWESWYPVESLDSAAGRRWRNHVLLYAVSAACSWAVIRVTPVVVALAVQSSRAGLLNGSRLPLWARWAIALPALDLVTYAGHRLMHSVYILWRVHAVHHSDRDYDVSTAGRFHPIEVIVTQGIYLGAIALLAPPVAAVFTLQILIIFENMFVHANTSLPAPVERAVRWLFITPDLHRIHHSDRILEQNRNFGELFPWWDKLFGTYSTRAACHPVPVATGLSELDPGADTLAVGWMLTLPFRVTTASTSPAPTQPPR
jgi:sterol desaturase/sphingolipid hydroxylase (fatty acid hydroxylase superfamily)